MKGSSVSSVRLFGSETSSSQWKCSLYFFSDRFQPIASRTFYFFGGGGKRFRQMNMNIGNSVKACWRVPVSAEVAVFRCLFRDLFCRRQQERRRPVVEERMRICILSRFSPLTRRSHSQWLHTEKRICRLSATRQPASLYHRMCTDTKPHSMQISE